MGNDIQFGNDFLWGITDNGNDRQWAMTMRNDRQ